MNKLPYILIINDDKVFAPANVKNFLSQVSHYPQSIVILKRLSSKESFLSKLKYFIIMLTSLGPLFIGKYLLAQIFKKNVIEQTIRCFGIQTFLLQSIDEPKFIHHIKTNNIKYALSCASQIYSKEFLAACQIPILNYHPGSLKINRGRYPFFWTCFLDFKPMMTCHFIVEKIDAGKVLLEKPMLGELCMTPPFLTKTYAEQLPLFMAETVTYIENTDHILNNYDDSIEKKGIYRKTPSLNQVITFWFIYYQTKIKNKFIRHFKTVRHFFISHYCNLKLHYYYIINKKIKPRHRISLEVMGYQVDVAQSVSDLKKVFKLRRNVYLKEILEIKNCLWPKYDIDLYDFKADHLIIRPTGSNHIVGTYRIFKVKNLRESYIDQVYDLRNFIKNYSQFLEVGRACIDPDFRGQSGLFALWKGIDRYTKEANCTLLLGLASIWNTDYWCLNDWINNLEKDKHHFQESSILPKKLLNIDVKLINIKTIDAFKGNSLLNGYLSLGSKFVQAPYYDQYFNNFDLLGITHWDKINSSWKKRFAL